MYKKYARSVRRSKPARKSSRRPRRVSVSSAVKKYVKKTLHSQIENKYYNEYSNANVIYNNGTAGNFTCKNLVPSISQGVGQGQRIGNEVRPVKWTLDMLFYSKNYDNIVNVSNNNLFRMVIFNVRSDKSLVTPPPSGGGVCNSFFQLGSSSTGFQGNLLDMMLKLNKDNLNVFVDKQFKLSNYTDSGTTDTVNGVVSRKMSVNLLKFVPKKFIWNDTSPAYPINMSLFIGLFGVSQNNLSTLQPGFFTYTSNLQYEDA